MAENNNIIEKARLENFSDGVIAILITILVMVFEIPEDFLNRNYSVFELIEYLIPQLIPYAVSFLVIAAHLINHHLLFSKMKAVNATFIWLNLLFLFSLSLIVYPTALLGQNHNQEAATMLLIGAYFFKAVTFRWLHHFAIFKSGLYITKSSKKELRKEDILSWLKGPLLEVIAFFLIFIDFRLALGLIFVVTLTDIIPPKKL
ncbi:TMEM175 family protein [Hwangdonia lutea]|uniref:TMEM175 family protein n=1 Tax=Hwangdonia lutea TaxID=3075823 RepID=A0AA97HSL0_9FLAO|nr:TMEM175 family protein [Hwangdonia sp. SCSIO 19198]WOD44583.1 TMEM175 family protein [Hwangdonia sp. SCSIO 19198]